MKTKEFTRLAYTGLVVELEHLKIETRLIDEKFANAKASLARIDETCDLSIEEKATRRKWKNTPIFDCAD